jgi:hypothetical protein
MNLFWRSLRDDGARRVNVSTHPSEQEPPMTDALDKCLANLRDAPIDRSLAGLTPAVTRRILAAAEADAAPAWRLRAAVIILTAASGTMLSATANAGPAGDVSPFSAWSELAPSTLLDDGP